MLKQLLLAGAALAVATGAASAKDLNSIGITLGSLGNPFFVALAAGCRGQGQGDQPERQGQHRLGRLRPEQAVHPDRQLHRLRRRHDPAQRRRPARRSPRRSSGRRRPGSWWWRSTSPRPGADATVQTNNVQAGEIACQYIADKLGEEGGKVIIQNGPQVGAVIDRVNGCKEVLAKNPKIEILSDDQDGKGSREGGLNIMQGHLTRFPRDRRGVHDQRPAGDRQRPRRQAARPQRVHHHLGRRCARHRDGAQGQHPGPGLGQPGPLRDGADRRSRSATRS